MYKLNHPSIAPAKTFKLSDADYNDFKTWLSTKDFSYTTESERKLEDLKLMAMKEKSFDAISPQYELLKKKLAHDKTHDLEMNKEEVREFVENEIVSRYYYQNGRMESSFDSDDDIKIAVKALSDPAVFTAIMNRNYKEK